jgi:hypothetical protein
MRQALDGWIKDNDDKGQYPRSRESIREGPERYPRFGLSEPSSRIYSRTISTGKIDIVDYATAPPVEPENVAYFTQNLASGFV